MATTTTHVFAHLDGIDIELLVHWPKASTESAPVLMMVHGGGFICGDSKTHPPLQIEHFLSQGYVIVSPNYPLAPQSTVFTQIKAIVQAWDWVHRRKNGLAAVATMPLDLTKTSAFGGSAASALLIFAMKSLSPRPATLTLIYPYLALLRPESMGDLHPLGGSNVPASLDRAKTFDETPQAQPVQGSSSDCLLQTFFWRPGQPEPELNQQVAFLYSLFEIQSTSLATSSFNHFAKSALGFDSNSPDLGEEQKAKLHSVDPFALASETEWPPTLVLQGMYDVLSLPALTREWVTLARKAPNNPAIEYVESDARGGDHIFDWFLQGVDDAGFLSTFGLMSKFMAQRLGRKHT